MGYKLLWLESLVTALVFLAALTALATHARGPRTQRRAPLLLGALMMILIGLAATFIALVHFNFRLQLISFGSVLSWTILFILTAVVVLIRGLRKGTEGNPRARNWPLRRLLLALGALCIVTWITFANLDTAVKMQLATVRSEAGARILALAPAPVPAEANAAAIYLDAFELMAQEKPIPSFWKEDTRGWEKYDRTSIDPKNKAFTNFLEEQQAALVLLRHAASMPGCRFERDYFLGIEMLLPEIQQFRRGTMLLAYDALASAARGMSRQALEDVAAIFQIARQLDEPILISLIVSIAIEETGFRVLQDVLELAPPKKEDLAVLYVHPSEGYRMLLQRGMMMEEAALGLTCFGMISTEPLPHFFSTIEGGSREDPYLAAFLGSSFYRVFMLADDLENYRSYMRNAQELSRKSQYEMVSGMSALDQRLRRRRGILTNLLAPALTKCFVSVAKGEAMHRLSRLGLAATAYRLKHGKLPASLEVLTPEFIPRIPTDPFDGKPMRMKIDGADLLIYSIGPDAKDDGGTVGPSLDGWNGDIVFRLKGK
jgi:hypothetical protein